LPQKKGGDDYYSHGANVGKKNKPCYLFLRNGEKYGFTCDNGPFSPFMGHFSQVVRKCILEAALAPCFAPSIKNICDII
jgi:hypothetical protein